MSSTTKTRRPATMDELRAAIPSATEAQLADYHRARLTAAQARRLHEFDRATGYGRHQFERLAEQRAKETGCDLREAMSALCSEQPSLYADFRRERYMGKPPGRHGKVQNVRNRAAPTPTDVA